MNRKERRITKHLPGIEWRGKTYTPEEANQQAIAEYQANNAEAAVEIFSLMIARLPGYADAYNNRGAILQQLGRHGEALASYDQAIAVRPDYAEAHFNRANLMQAQGRHREALAGYDHAVAIRPDYADAYNNRGNSLQEMQLYSEALASYDRALALNPGQSIIYVNRGNTLRAIKKYEEALASYRVALAIKPDCTDAHNNQGYALQQMRRYEEALASYDKAIACRPDYAEAHNNRGAVLQEMKRLDEAAQSYLQAIALRPNYAEAYNNLGNTLAAKGDMQAAEAMFGKAFALKPDFAIPLCGLTRIRKYQDANHADIKNIQMLLQQPGTSLYDKEHLYYALAKAYDDCGDYDAAFKYCVQANRISNRMVSYQPAAMTARNNEIMAVFGKEFFAKLHGFASASRLPLFIVGMPRSGTTLIAGILSNHPLVASAGELPTIIDMSIHLQEQIGACCPYPQAVREIGEVEATRLIDAYETRLRRDAGADKSYVIDKHPLNFRHLGFIAMLFPNARVIHCTRHPLDTCISNYFQRFSLTYDYAFDLQNIGHFYGEYLRMMEHWRQVLPNQVLEVHYEEMIGNTEQIARTAIDFLGLEWNERCLTPHTNSFAVETASQWQVRQPIYNESMERWRHYERHLTALKETLLNAGI